jgi:hypothetical protein
MNMGEMRANWQELFKIIRTAPSRQTLERGATNLMASLPQIQNLRDLYVKELQDLFSVELQLLEALPKMEADTTTPMLKQAWSILECMWNVWSKFSKIFRKRLWEKFVRG